MTFEEILPQIKAGQKVIRDSWTGSELYIYEVQQPLENGEAVDPYFLIKTKEGASRISSVLGLNESPHTAMVFPWIWLPK